ncbi:MAG: hypothetical protein KJ607_14720, partial [Bacteroidetes bacterium]|nr:hypothetical protein [Bacteroidota bacterium]
MKKFTLLFGMLMFITSLSYTQVDWCNLQWPTSSAICEGTVYTVYAQAYEPGVTDAVGQGAGITAWIGYNDANTNPDTWTNWVPSTYNADVGNNDEYKADLNLPAGTYYYASRFEYSFIDTCGGYNAGGGGFWDGVINVSQVLTVYTLPTATATSNSPVCTGSALNLTGGPGAMSAYTWSGPNAYSDIIQSPCVSGSATPLMAGTYTITVTDGNGCTDTETTDVTVNNLTDTTSHTNVSCNGGNNGSIDLTVYDGTPGYIYFWSTGATTQDLTGLTADSYTVTVTDSDGCTKTDSVTITEPAYMATYTDTIAKILWDSRNCRTYTIEKIGDQWWMTENIDFGVMISSTTGGQLQTDNGILEKYCYNNAPANCELYGGLYEWNEMMQYNPSDAADTGTIQGICPTGWHIPTDAEWAALTNYLGGESVAGGKLKETGTTHWSIPNTGATNESGFTGLPGGYRNYSNGSFSNSGNYGYWWSATEYNSTYAWERYLYYSLATVSRDSINKTTGFSVRCLKDIDIFDNLTISIFDFENVSCNGGADGSASLTVLGGTPPYAYLWSNSATSDSLNGLAAGLYYVTVTDDASATAVDSVEITEPAALTANIFSQTNVSCNGDSIGSVIFIASGGTAPYNYAPNDTLTNLTAGTYYVTVTDLSGCSVVDTAYITQPAALTASISSSTNVSCNGGNDGDATVTTGGGTAPYS